MTVETKFEFRAPNNENADNAHVAVLQADAYHDKLLVPQKPQGGSLASAYDWASGTIDLGAQIVVGAANKAYEAIKEHPVDTAVSIAEGVAVGVALIAAAPIAGALGASAAVVAGVGVLAEVAIVGLTADGMVTAATDSIAASENSANSANVLMHKSEHTEADIETARLDIQKQTGGAAIEIAGCATLALGAAGSAIKATSRLANILKSSAKASSDANGGASLPELTLTQSERPALAMDEPPKVGKSATIEKPGAKAGSDKVGAEKSSESIDGVAVPSKQNIWKLSDSVTDFIGKRNGKVDLKSLIEQRKALHDDADDDLSLHFKIARAAKLPDWLSLRAKGLNDEPAIRQLISGSPEATALYDEYLVSKAAHSKVSKQIDEELEIRRTGLAKIVNDERKNVFPDGVVPKIKVERQGEDAIGSASYHKGTIRVKDEDLIDGDSTHRLKVGDNLTEFLLHETKHAEQDALRIRKYIDDITGGDTSGRSLTNSELEAVATKMYGVADIDAKAIVSDVSKQRAGRPLTESESERATELEKSFAENYSANHKADKDQLARLAAVYQNMFQPDNAGFGLPTQIYLEDFKFYETFQNPSPELEALKREYDNLPKNKLEHTIFDEEFEKRSAPIVERALSQEIETATAIVKDNYQEYRNWLHEREAWATSKAAQRSLSRTAIAERLLRALFSYD
ncbi:MAG: hypothetical protein P4L53_20660 [Candidatus Obscuribacterales bacterium]|nr:hypothetical protein [Candidatus Obscuribacterales bacterium]